MKYRIEFMDGKEEIVDAGMGHLSYSGEGRWAEILYLEKIVPGEEIMYRIDYRYPDCNVRKITQLEPE